MALYRLFFYDLEGHIESVREINAETDGDALASIQPLLDGGHAELWCEARRLKTFNGPVAA